MFDGELKEKVTDIGLEFEKWKERVEGLERKLKVAEENIEALETATKTSQDAFSWEGSFFFPHRERKGRIGKLVDLILDHLNLEYKHVDEEVLVPRPADAEEE